MVSSPESVAEEAAPVPFEPVAQPEPTAPPETVMASPQVAAPPLIAPQVAAPSLSETVAAPEPSLMTGGAEEIAKEDDDIGKLRRTWSDLTATTKIAIGLPVALAAAGAIVAGLSWLSSPANPTPRPPAVPQNAGQTPTLTSGGAPDAIVAPPPRSGAEGSGVVPDAAAPPIGNGAAGAVPAGPQVNAGKADLGKYAYFASHEFVEHRLEFPYTAEFPRSNLAEVTPLGNDQYVVKAYVDSDNSRNTNRRTNYTAKMQHDPKAQNPADGWRCLDMQMSSP